MDLVLDIGKFRLKGAFFQGDEPTRAFRLPYDPSQLREGLHGFFFERALISTQHDETLSVLKELGIVPVVLEKGKSPEAFGALNHYPQNPCIVIDLGTSIRFFLITPDGKVTGNSVFPLSDFEKIERPESPVGSTEADAQQSGLYWGILGAIERISDEIRQQFDAPSTVKVLATGGGLPLFDPDDLAEIVDTLDPLLTLNGLHEILKEIQKDV